MFTSHGHHIVGTPHEERPEGQTVMRCGGPRLCKVCGGEVLSRMYTNEAKEEPDTSYPTYLLN